MWRSGCASGRRGWTACEQGDTLARAVTTLQPNLADAGAGRTGRGDAAAVGALHLPKFSVCLWDVQMDNRDGCRYAGRG